MKKFLTVLLALSVVFTYSFSAVGSAFAATAPNFEQATKIKQAADYTKSNLPASVQKAYEAVLAQDTDTYMTKEAWEKASGAIVTALGEEIDKTRDGYLADKDTADGEAADWDAYDYVYAAQKLFTGYSFTDLVAKFTSDTDKCALIAAHEQFKMDMDNALSVYDKVNVDALYSKTSPENGDTYYEQAVKAIKESKEKLQKYFIKDDGTIQNLEEKVSTVKANGEGLKNIAFNGGFGPVPMIKVLVKYYEGTNNTVVQYYYLDGIPTISDEEGMGAEIEATTAAIKAQVAKNIAVFLKSNTTAADKAFVEDYATFYNYLAEEIKMLSVDGAKKLASDVVAHENMMSGVKAGYAETFDKVVAGAEDMKAFGAKYAAEKDSTGAFVRDAAEVEKKVKEAIVAEYAGKVGIGVKTASSFADAKAAIAAMTTKGDAAKLAFDKEAKKADLDDEMAIALDSYYDLEAAAVKTAYAAAKEKVDAAKDKAAVDKVTADLTGIKKMADVDKLFTSGKMEAELDTQVAALQAYIDYKNSAVSGAYESAYVLGRDQAKKLLTEYYIENDARTVEEMKALTGAVEAVAATLPTTGSLAAAKKAAQDAIDALPTAAKTTSADKAAYQNAFDLAKTYNDMVKTATGTAGKLAIAADKVQALKDAIQRDFYEAFAKADKKDKAALKAIAADVKAANDEVGTNKLFTTEFVNPAKAALEAIQEAEKAAVLAALKALPINVTLDDKAQIEAARKLYDAYVAEYTDYDDADNGYVAAQFNPYNRDLALAEAALSILEKDAAIKATEGLKLSVSTKLYKKSNKIRVNWKVKDGDASYIDGYQVYKSTKAQKNYKFMGKTKKSYMDNKKNLKKGTRYFYKVRAYVVVDGQKYFSDYSNKGNRIYK